MSAESAKQLGKVSQGAPSMSTALELRDLLSEIAGPARMGENVKACLARISSRTGLGERRARALWNGEARSLRPAEVAALVRAAREQKALEDARIDHEQLRLRLARIEAALGLHAAAVAGAEASNARRLGHAG